MVVRLVWSQDVMEVHDSGNCFIMQEHIKASLRQTPAVVLCNAQSVMQWKCVVEDYQELIHMNALDSPHRHSHDLSSGSVPYESDPANCLGPYIPILCLFCPPAADMLPGTAQVLRTAPHCFAPVFEFPA